MPEEKLALDRAMKSVKPEVRGLFPKC
jgi:hypothetical protein